ncbi:hypothetical protein BRC90_05525 [Halobacteriales archaeon QS_4_69_34]|nr:MAG: hypothetical protein BRC90_05525 [Halobacteriales archaeon QS_4_69_34]
MVERTEERTRESERNRERNAGTVTTGSDVLAGDDRPTREGDTPRESGERSTADADGAPSESRRRERGGEAFSPRTFAVALGLAAVGVFLGGFVPVVGAFGGLAGVFLVAFGFGLASERRHYVETGLAGTAAAGVGTFFDFLLWSVLGVGLAVVALGAGAGLVVALSGHYFGRDLRVGLTADL